MSDTVIKAENLGKRYTIGHQRGRGDQTTFREVLVQNARNLWNKSRDLVAGRPVIVGDTLEEVWALKDVSFEIKRGEAVGIIGRNGAGKSTLLKILSRITEPTEGRVTIRGRVASLLEVGTGFHSELTGRENIYLNGTILGMTRTEIKKKFDEIVAFSEVERYLDTPVKRYSSGMYVRLAFAVAAHLEPEILVVDEVLAVGDAEFQKKCLGKMGDVTQEGRTVLFVSHNMGAVSTLCSSAILLNSGRLTRQGTTQQVIDEYERLEALEVRSEWTAPYNDDAEAEAHLKKIEILDCFDQKRHIFKSSEPIFIKFTIDIDKPNKNLKIGFDLTRNGLILFRSEQTDSLPPGSLIKKGTNILVCRIPPDILREGDYFLRPMVSIHMVHWIQNDIAPAVLFTVRFDASRSSYHMSITESNHPGIIFPQLIWTVELTTS
ncbi:MAG: ABC transporter ATP-binding protein [Pseudomonadota bacterium]|nr:ABC transporter ATP-binding protein [Pseudomonadota bacterium]